MGIPSVLDRIFNPEGLKKPLSLAERMRDRLTQSKTEQAALKALVAEAAKKVG